MCTMWDQLTESRSLANTSFLGLDKRREAAHREQKLLLGRFEDTSDQIEFRMYRSISFTKRRRVHSTVLELLALACDN